MSKTDKKNQDSTSTQDAPRLKSIPEVLTYLTGQGFKVARRTLYLHKQQGILREQVGGGFTLKAVDDYARRNLDRPGIDAPPSAALSDDKARLLKAQADKIEFDNKLKQGQFLPYSLVEQGLAERAAFLKNDLLNFGPHVVDQLLESAGAYLKESGVIDGGSLARIAPDLLNLYDTRLEKWLGRYANPKGLLEPE